MDRFEINISLDGQHWALVKVPTGDTLDEARQKARRLETSLQNMENAASPHIADAELPQFDVSIIRWRENGTSVGVWDNE